ncbi:ABC transporter ATP-binding protein [Arcanobacterium haemolyticum]|nr:ABC transporter ATP-binding protein [Arcanobacterium haemolyticum]
MTLNVSHLTFSYGFTKDRVLDDVSFTIGEKSITGIFGRNGSGKSTIGMLLSGLMHTTTQSITLNGEPVYENSRAVESIAYISDFTCVLDDSPLKDTFALWSITRPAWNGEYAEALAETFGLNLKKKPRKLSRGQRSTLNAILGLAARCPITIFDEVHLGMDAVAREMFYRALLAEFTQEPRTFILSSHLIDEIEHLLDHVIFIDKGKILDEGEPDELRTRHAREGELPSLTGILTELTLTPRQRNILGGGSL